MELRCKKIIVTGGSRGIGFAITQKLISLGAQVVICGRNRDTLEEAAGKLAPKQVWPIVLDVRQVDSFSAFIREAADRMGCIDGLVNNAGICAYEREWGWNVFNQTEDDWDSVINTNLKAPFFLSRAIVQYFLDHNVQGNILNVISEAAYVPASGSYGASKAGLMALTKGLAGLVASKGIVVNAIAPGTTETDMVNLEHEYAMKRQRNGRLGRAEEMADLAAFLMSYAGENIIGQTVLSCGGSTL